MSGYSNAWKLIDPAISIGKRIALEQENRKLFGLCPFHPDEHPSLGFFPYKDGSGYGWKCVSCGATGNTAQFVQRFDKIPFKQAVGRVIEEARDPLVRARAPIEDKGAKTVTFPLAYYALAVQSLEKSPAGQDWLAKRGIGMDIARKFYIGFVQDAFLTVGDSHPWRQKGWITFPTLSANRQIVTAVKLRSLAGKKEVVNNQTVRGICNAPHTKLSMFNLLTADLSGDVWICEGEPDTLVLAQAGLQATSMAGASIAPTDAECEMLSSAKRIFLAGDNDGTVGTAAMDALRKRLPREKTYIIRWQNGCKDANDVLTRECGNDREKFSAVIERIKGEVTSLTCV